jgi:hypothetical protein
MVRRSITSGPQPGLQFFQIQNAQFIPFGEDHHAIGALDSVIGILAQFDVEIFMRLALPSAS